MELARREIAMGLERMLPIHFLEKIFAALSAFGIYSRNTDARFVFKKHRWFDQAIDARSGGACQV
jgi:hypothetical protein